MTDTTLTSTVHPVDQKLPALQLVPLALQHVLVMYAGAVAVPLIIGALKLPKEQMAQLINADLFACGIVTLIQALGFWRFGIKLPVMMGVTFAAVGPMVVMAGNPELGLLGIYGAVGELGVWQGKLFIGMGGFAHPDEPLLAADWFTDDTDAG